MSKDDGMAAHRFHLAPLASKMIQRSSDEDDEEVWDKDLKEAGLYDKAMPSDEKKSIFEFLKESKMQAAKEGRERQAFETSHDKYLSEGENNGGVAALKAGVPQSTEHTSSDEVKMPSSPSLLISEDSGSDCEQISKASQEMKELSIRLVKIDHQLPTSSQSVSQSSTPVLRSAGRGRATPTVKHRTPGRIGSTSAPTGLQGSSDSRDSIESDLALFTQSARKVVAESHQDKLKEKDDDKVNCDADEVTNNEKNSTTDAALSNSDEIRNLHRSSDSSPQEETDITSSKDDIITVDSENKVFHGKYIADVSPLQGLVKNKAVNSCPPYLRDLDKFLDDKVQWMAEAKKATAALRVAYWEDMLVNTTKWGSPITECGSTNMNTLFKRSTFSGLFSDSGSYSSKQQTNSPVADRVSIQNWSEGPSNSVRKGEMSRDNRDQNISEEKPSKYSSMSVIPAEPINSDQSDVLDESREPWSETPWRSLRAEKKKFIDDDSDSAPTSPFNNSAEASELDGDWKPKNYRNKRNGKRGGKINNDGDFEPLGKASQRGRGGTGKRSRGVRVARGALARPDEHVHQTNNSDARQQSKDPFEFETTDENDVNSKKSAWLSKDSPAKPREDVISGIPGVSFYSGPKSSPLNRKYEPVASRVTRRNQARNKLGEKRDNVDANLKRVPCPICSCTFLESEIMGHASECTEFSAAAEGDAEKYDMDRKGDNVEVVNHTSLSTAITRSFNPSTSENADTLCKLCLEHFPTDFSLHMKECIENHSTPTASSKRAVSEDEEGPAKKIMRGLSLQKK